MITPPGEGGVAALRLAGRHSRSYLQTHFRIKTNDSTRSMRSKKSNNLPKPFVLRYGHFVDANDKIIDEIMAVYMPAGKSYTGAEQVEIFCHGGRRVVQTILDELINSGARAAEPGEFTRMAFLAGRIDLSRAEAVAEIIAANTDSSYNVAREHLLGSYTEHISVLRTQIIEVLAEIEASVDYPEEEIELAIQTELLGKTGLSIGSIDELLATYKGGRIVKEGFRIAIGGRPNAGKSSLFNQLLRQERALVTPTAGTTRDYLSEWIDLDGFAVNLIDTAGIRKEGGSIERAGMASAKKIIAQADLLLWIVDLSEPEWGANCATDLEQFAGSRILVIGNKIDIAIGVVAQDNRADISCKTGAGIDSLKVKLAEHIREQMPDLTSGAVITSARHHQKLTRARELLFQAKAGIEAGQSPEMTAVDLRQAADAIDEITGKVYTEEILEEIFSKFCIGK